MRQASFCWRREDEIVVLQDIDFCISASCSGRLITVLGRVGSGKSALLHAILGEMHLKSGCVVLPSNQQLSIGYASQSAFIQNASLKDNILFGKDYDESLFRQVVKACALDEELATLPNGCESQIGDKVLAALSSIGESLANLGYHPLWRAKG